MKVRKGNGGDEILTSPTGLPPRFSITSRSMLPNFGQILRELIHLPAL
ncbi:MAG: hypothetical protein ACE5HR_01440 [bacterium]